MRFVACLGLVALLMGVSCRQTPSTLPGVPRLVLWAWERPEDLRYLVPSATGVAYLAETIELERGYARVRPRFQPLIVPPGAALIAVVRLESQASADLPSVSEVVQKIVAAVRGVSVRALQIDYDARLSQRLYYRTLVTQLRRTLPQNLPLELTALVSWCQSDNWIQGMPVGDVVPMFFRMGADPHSINEPLREPLCFGSIGISTDELSVPVPRGNKRVYVFSERPWTESRYRAVLQASREWF